MSMRGSMRGEPIKEVIKEDVNYQSPVMRSERPLTYKKSVQKQSNSEMTVFEARTGPTTVKK